MNWKEFDIFYHVENYNITSKINTNINSSYICPFNIKKIKTIQINYTISFHYIWCDILMEFINNKLFYKHLKQYVFLNKRKEKQFNVFYIYYHIFTKILITNHYITNNVNVFLKKYSYKYIGMQIRVGNEDLKEVKFSDINDIYMMLRIAKESNQYKKWFVTGDSQRIKQNLSIVYKQIFLYSTNLTKHYAKNPKDFNIIVEHEILSKSSLLIISRSTFGLSALLKSGLLLKTNEVLCYVIKKRHIYNVYNEFISFHKLN